MEHGTFYCSKEALFWKYFTSNNLLVYCKDIKRPLLEMGVTYVTGGWQFKRRLKCVFLHNENVYNSIPIGHLVELKENH